MSDQQDTSSDLGSTEAGQHQQVQVEGIGGMRVSVTNIVDGFFRFASTRSASNLSSSGMSDSGRSSPSRQRPRSSSPIRPKPIRRRSSASAAVASATAATTTKKVKFKEDPPKHSNSRDNDTDTPDTNDTPPPRPMEPLDAQLEASKFYMDESSWHTTPRSRLRDDSSIGDLGASSIGDLGDSSYRGRRRNQRSKLDKNSDDERDSYMDASTSSQASWDVRVTAGGDAEKHQTHFEKAGIVRTDDLGYGLDGAQDPANAEPMWFEKYMPNWVIAIRALCGSVVLDERFQILMVVLIMANALCMGLATFDFISDDPKLASIFERIDFVFLCIFTVELALQFGYWGYQVFTDGWLLFDVFTIVSSWLLDGVQVFRSFRVFRAFRLVVRIPILKSLVYAVLHVMPRISSIMGLFALIIYIYAVMVTTLYKDYYPIYTPDANYFGRLDYSLFTLFQFVTLEGWADIVRDVAAQDYFAYFIFGSFLTISGFILYSLVVAVVCDSFLMVEAKIRQELKAKAKADRERRKLLKRRKNKRNGGDEDTTNFDGTSMGFDESNDSETENLDKSLSMQRSRLTASRMGEAGEDNNPDIAPKLSLASLKPTNPGDHPGKASQAPPPPPSTTHRKGVPPPLRKGVPPPLATPKTKRATVARPARTAPTKATAKANHIQRVDPPEDEQTDDEGQSNSFAFTEATSPTARGSATTKTLAIGELERKKRDKANRKKKPVKQRIKRVRKRLDKLTAAQSEILSALDDMCKEMERRNGISEEVEE